MYTTVYVHVWHVLIIYNIYSLHYKECYLNYKLISEMIILYLLLSFGILYPNIISYIQYGWTDTCIHPSQQLYISWTTSLICCLVCYTMCFIIFLNASLYLAYDVQCLKSLWWWVCTYFVNNCSFLCCVLLIL